MGSNELISTKPPKERAFLVAAEIRDSERLMDTEDSLEELAESGVEPGGGTAPSPEAETLAAERKRLLYAAIHESPEPAREVLYLRLLGGLSFKEIGDVLNEITG